MVNIGVIIDDPHILSILTEMLSFPWTLFSSNILIIFKVLSGFISAVLNPFVPNVPFLYPQKTSENRKVSGGRERVHWEEMG